MNIQLNGKTCELQDQLKIDQALLLLGYDPSLVAVAVNGIIVPKREYGTVVLADQDRLDVVMPMQGG